MAITAAALIANDAVGTFVARGDATLKQERQDVVDRLKRAIPKPPAPPQPAQPPILASAAIDAVLSQGKLSPSQIIFLQFLRALCVCTDGLPTTKTSTSADEAVALSAKAAEDIITSVLPRISNDDIISSKVLDGFVGAVDTLRTATASTVSLDQKALKAFGLAVYNSQPLRSLRVVVQKRAFTDVDFTDDVRGLVEVLLTLIIDEAIDIGASDLQKRALSRYKPLTDDFEARQKILPVAFAFLKSIKSLARVTGDPGHVALLYNQNYRSTRQIAQSMKDSFASNMKSAGMPEVTALQIHQAAERSDCWNEHLWLQLIESSRQNFVPIQPRKPGEPAPTTTTNRGNITDTFLLEDRDVDPAYSVTSLLAYFADLMKLMQDTRVKGSDLSLLYILSRRRPDLEKLELTMSNAQVLLPYICLVNEVLESFIRYNEKGIPKRRNIADDLLSKDYTGADIITAYNTPINQSDLGDTADLQVGERVHRPATIDEGVYGLVSKQMFPFTVFPYDRARDAIRQYCMSFSVKMTELFETFDAPEMVLQDLPDSVRDPLTKDATMMNLRAKLIEGAKEVSARQQIAEALGLQQTDYAAITRETFFPKWLADLMVGSAGGRLSISDSCPWDAATLWGYIADDATAAKLPTATDAMISSVGTLGLSAIKRQFMRRSGLDFQGVLDLFKSRSFGQHLVIVNDTGSHVFDGGLEKLRLLSSSADPPFKPLSTELCFSLQSFLRLRWKLQWSIKQLDAAVFCLQGKESEISSQVKSPYSSQQDNLGLSKLVEITPFVLKNICFLQKLSELTGLDKDSLLPLWGDIDSFGNSSLLHRRFLTAAVRQVDKVFQVPDDGNYFVEDGDQARVGQHLEGICASIRWPFEYVNSLLRQTGLEDAALDLTSLSVLYRHSLICRVMGVSPKQSAQFFKVLFRPGMGDPFATPENTFQIVREWKLLLDNGWTIDSLMSTLLGPENSVIPDKSGLSSTAAIIEGSKNISKSLPFLSTPSPTTQDVADCVARTFDASNTSLILDYVEGKHTQSAYVSFDNKEDLQKFMDATSSWPPTLKAVPDPGIGFQAQLLLSSALSEDQKSKILLPISSLPKTKAEEVVKSLQLLVALVERPQTLLRTRFGETALKSSSLGNFMPQFVSKGQIEQPTSESQPQSDEQRVFEEKQVQDRRNAFVALSAPVITRDLLETLIITTIKAAISDTDTSVIAVLLSRVVQVSTPDGKIAETAMSALQSLVSAPDDSSVSSQNLSSYFTPPTTDLMTFQYKGQVSVIHLSVNGLNISYFPGTKSFAPFRMTGGQAYLLQGNFAQDDLLWSTSKTQPSALPPKMLLPLATTDSAVRVIAAVSRVAMICQTFGLTVDELEFLSLPNTSTMLSVDLNQPKLQDLVRLQEYVELRKLTSSNKTTKTLISLVSWLSTGSNTDLNALASRISESTGWAASRVTNAIKTKHVKLREDQIMALIQKDERFLYSLQGILGLHERIAQEVSTASQPSLAVLFSLSSPRKTLAADDSSFARTLQMKLQPEQLAAAEDRLAQSQQTALVQFLLQKTYVRDGLKIDSANGLFEYFLMDVQMGPQLRTSRVKQAISVLQLFAQRCLLGYEKDIDKNALAREKWDWMQQYSLWEARRKLFLYPENWLEPSLRDDKSELFEQLETSLMQKDLSQTTVLEALKMYIQGLNDIATLEIVAYLREVREGDEVYHLFGRTRSAPSALYHRTLTVTRLGAKSDLIWRPWRRIDMDIPSVENEWDGNRLASTGCYLLPLIQNRRLYLFMPQVTLKTVSTTPEILKNPDTKFETLREASAATAVPSRVWEVTMAWTECVRGVWAPKRVSAGAVTIPFQQQSIAQFRFDPIVDNNNLMLLVSVSTGSSEGVAVGRFAFSNGQISLVQSVVSGSLWSQIDAAKQNSWAPARPLQPIFQSTKVVADSLNKDYTSTALPQDSEQDPNLYRNRNNVLWVPPAIDALIRSKSSLTMSETWLELSWTLSPNYITPGMSTLDQTTWTPDIGGPYTALAVGGKYGDGSATSYFMVPRDDPGRTWWTPTNLRSKMDLTVVDHTFSDGLMKATTSQIDPLKNIYSALATLAAQKGREAWGARQDLPAHELGQPSAIYNWEIGLHAILFAVDRLASTQQYEDALELARLVFDPTADVKGDRLVKRTEKTTTNGQKTTMDADVISYLDNRADILDISQSAGTKKSLVNVQDVTCWRFPPFQDIARKIMNDRKDTDLKMSDMRNLLQSAVMERRSSGTLVHATARGRPQAYMKWIMMKYVEILVACGDIHFRRSTLESLPLAIQRYIEAAYVLGEEPPKVPQLANRRIRGKTFNDLSDEDSQFELGQPFTPELEASPNQSSEETDAKKEKIVCLLKTQYFGVPMNPKFKTLRALVGERLFNARNGLDIQGRPVSYSLMEPLIDPGALIALEKAGFSMSNTLAMVMGDQNSPLPRQRFEILLQRALELCAELKSLGERMVSAIEKKETETFASLRARYSTNINRMMLDIKNASLREAEQSVEALQINRDDMASQLAYYLELAGEPSSRIPTSKDPWIDIDQDIDMPTDDDLRMSRHEKEELDKAESAAKLTLIAQGIDTLVAPFFMVPTISSNIQPMGMGATITLGGGSTIAQMLQAGSAALRIAGMIKSDDSVRAGRKAQLTRQLQDRRMQANMRGRGIKGIDKQIEIQHTRIKIATQEIERQQVEIDECAQIDEWYRSKYSGAQLYAWMEKSLRSVYFQAYTLAMAVASRAESAVNFEQGRKASILRPGGYWDASRDGLLAADHLYLDLKRLETRHLESRPYDFELNKTVSIRQINPLALLRLRSTGSTVFSLDEGLFDLDFPGHYMRRIRCVAVTIPAVVGAFNGINATLTLIQHKYRVSTLVNSAEEYASAATASATGAFQTDNLPITSVAICSGSDDPGTFDLSFGGPQYVPFEGAGAISTWRLEFPSTIRRFDFESISDVVLRVQYTASDGGARLRSFANATVSNAIKAVTDSPTARKDGLWAMLDLKTDYSNEWYGFTKRMVAGANGDAANANVSLQLGNVRDRLPFWARNVPALKIKSVTLVGKDAQVLGSIKISACAGTTAKDGDKVGVWRVLNWNDLAIDSKGMEGWVLSAEAKTCGGKEPGAAYMLLRYTL